MNYGPLTQEQYENIMRYHAAARMIRHSNVWKEIFADAANRNNTLCEGRGKVMLLEARADVDGQRSQRNKAPSFIVESELTLAFFSPDENDNLYLNNSVTFQVFELGTGAEVTRVVQQNRRLYGITSWDDERRLTVQIKKDLVTLVAHSGFIPASGRVVGQRGARGINPGQALRSQ